MFDNIFKRSDDKNSDLNRIYLTNEDQFDEMLNKSIEKKFVIFKHSTRCGISSMVLRKFENKLSKSTSNDFDYYFLDILKNRDLSNIIADNFRIRHESPQLLVVKNEKLITHNSHFDILDIEL